LLSIRNILADQNNVLADQKYIVILTLERSEGEESPHFARAAAVLFVIPQPLCLSFRSLFVCHSAAKRRNLLLLALQRSGAPSIAVSSAMGGIQKSSHQVPLRLPLSLPLLLPLSLLFVFASVWQGPKARSIPP